MATTILSVDGMTCSSCVRHVESALRRLEGIEKVEVNLEKGKVWVEHDPSRSTSADLVRTLRGSGYESRAGA